MPNRLKTMLAALACLLPFVNIVMQGPSVSSTLLLGSIFPLYCLHKLGTWSHWKRMAITAALLLPYSFLAWWMPDRMNELRFHWVLLGAFYGIPAGMYLAYLAYSRAEGPSGVAWLAVALGLALVALYITRLIEPEDYIKITSTGVVRKNLEEGVRYNYLGFFYTEDLIIGIIPLTILALSSTIAILLPASRLGTVLALAGAGIAAFVNFSVLTRTTLVSSGIALAIVCWINRHAIRQVPLKRVAALACLLLVASGGLFFVRQKSPVQNALAYVDAMAQRMDKANEDGRIDHWLEAVQRIAERPEGDARTLMTSQYWAHNLFLDSALSTGVLGMLSIVAVFTLPLVRLYRVIAAGRVAASPLFQIVCVQFLAVWIAAQISPPNLAYFVFTMIATGFIYCLPHD